MIIIRSEPYKLKNYYLAYHHATGGWRVALDSSGENCQCVKLSSVYPTEGDCTYEPCNTDKALESIVSINIHAKRSDARARNIVIERLPDKSSVPAGCIFNKDQEL